MTLLGHGPGANPVLPQRTEDTDRDASGNGSVRPAPRHRRWPVVVMLASAIAAAAYVLPRSRGLEEHVAALQAPAQTVGHEPIDSERSRITDPAKANAAPAVTPDRATKPDAATGASPILAERTPASPSEASPRPERIRPHAHRGVERVAPEPVIEPPKDLVQEAPPPVKAVALASPPPPDRSRATRPTRWQSMDEALAACSGGFFERVLCRQRTRIAFCDGYWGRVPQCATAANDDVR